MVWKFVKLGSVCKIEKNIFRGSTSTYVGMEDIEGHTGRFLGSFEAKGAGSSTFHFTTDHVLYGRLRPYLNKVLVPNFEGHCSSEIFPLRPSEIIDRKFLYYWLSSANTVAAIDATCTGTRMPRANVKEVLSFDFPLPEREEQKRIVALLDQAFADIAKARALTEQNLKNARELFDCYLQHVCTKSEDGWDKYLVGEVCELYQGLAINRKTKHLLVEKSMLPLLRIKDLREGKFEQYIAEEGYPEKSQVFESDIIYTRTGQIGLVFRGFSGILHNNSFKVVPNQKISKDYLFWWLQHRQFKDVVIGLASRAAQPDITHTLFKKQKIVVPPLQYQTDFAEKIEKIAAETSDLEQLYTNKIQKLIDLKKSLLQKAFSGELTRAPAEAAA